MQYYQAYAHTNQPSWTYSWLHPHLFGFGGFISDPALVYGQLDFISPSAPKSNTVTFRRYPKIKVQSLGCDLANDSFVTSPGSKVSAFYEQYTRDLSGLLNKHAPMFSLTFTKGAAGRLSNSYLQAKAIRHQFKWIWCKDKSPQNQARPCKQIAQHNSLITTEKSNYYRNYKSMFMIQRNCGLLHSIPLKVLSSHGSQIGLANSFVTFFSHKIRKIRDSFSNSFSLNLFLRIKFKKKLDLRIREPMQICIHQRQLTKASEPSFDLEGGAQGQIWHHKNIPSAWYPTRWFHIANL